MSEILLKTNNLSKAYKGFYALDGVNMTINKGDIYGLIGRNGAGKTTLIRVITGLNKPTVGDFTLNVEKRIGAIGAIVEAPAIHYDKSGIDNLKIQAMLLGLKLTDEELNNALHDVGLNVDNRPARNYSLGMRQRLSIAVTLLSKPDFIILDEPTNGLDPEGIREVRELIKKLNEEKGITFLISSHMLSELDKVATVYGFIERGKLLTEISAESLHNYNDKTTYVFKVNTVDNLKQAIYNEYGFDDIRIISNTVFEMDHEIDILELGLALKKYDIKIESFEKKKVGLEDFYLSLIGGIR